MTVLMSTFLCSPGRAPAAAPERTILFVIDALAAGAPERIPLENIQRLKNRGCYYPAVRLPLPDHPPPDENYPYTCSIPNPVMMTGTVFLRPNREMVQEIFRGQKTAFITNCLAYDSISRGYSVYRALEQKDGWDDAPVIALAEEVIEKENPVFLRLHLQATGVAGLACADRENQAAPWYRDLWHPRSPYVETVKKADRLLGELVGWLETTGRMKNTVIIVVGDHGQAAGGGHPPYAEESSVTPMLIFGRGIGKDRTFDYAELIDIAPTIARLHGLPAPKDSIGRILEEVGSESRRKRVPPERYVERLNRALIERQKLPADERDSFFTIRHLARWHERFPDLKTLVEYLEKPPGDASPL